MVKEIIFLIRKLMHGAEMYTKELNKKYSITSAQLNCLSALYENGPLPPSQIAKHMMVKSSTVTGVRSPSAGAARATGFTAIGLRTACGPWLQVSDPKV